MSGEERGVSPIERVLMLSAIVALAVGLAVSEIVRWRGQAGPNEATKTLESEIAAARLEARAALSAVIAPERVAAVGASVYLIVVNGAPRGTAFVVDAQAGILATTAHTAASLPIGEGGAEVHVINRATPKPIRVTGVRPHAGYGAFRALVEDYQPMRKDSSIYAPLALALRDLALDAAFITVDPVDVDTGETRLGPALNIASEETLLSLTAGLPIAVIGYPYDTLDDSIMANVATPRVDRGVISAMIAPLDDVSEVADPVVANLIIHRLSTAGGSSGSPIVNADGDVIGLHSHGVESVSSNADGAAQRADVLYDLMSPPREAARLTEIFRPAWARRLSQYARADDVLPWSFYKEYYKPDETPPTTVGDIDYRAPTPFTKDVVTLSFEDAVEARTVPAPDILRAVGTPASQPSSFLLSEPGEYAETWFTVDRRRDAVIFAYDYSLRSRTASCPLTTYWRVRGGSRLEIQRPRASFELHLPATGDEPEDYHLVFRRDAACDRVSHKFMAGAISWDAPADSVHALRVPDDDNRPRGGDQRVVRIAHMVEVRASRFFTCAFFKKSHPDQCAKREFVELATPSQ